MCSSRVMQHPVCASLRNCRKRGSKTTDLSVSGFARRISLVKTSEALFLNGRDLKISCDSFPPLFYTHPKKPSSVTNEPPMQLFRGKSEIRALP